MEKSYDPYVRDRYLIQQKKKQMEIFPWDQTRMKAT